MFFGQIWSKKLKFYKLTEICYRGILLCPYFKFTFYFSKILWSIFSWSKTEVLQINQNLVHCCMLISILMFIFPKFLSFMPFWQIWSHNLDFFKLTDILSRGVLLYAYYVWNVYFFKIIFIHIFWVNLVSKSDVLLSDWSFVQGYILYAYYGFNVYLFQNSFDSCLF